MDTGTQIRQQIAADRRALRRLTAWLAGAAIASTAIFVGAATSAGKATDTGSGAPAASSSAGSVSSDSFDDDSSGFSAGVGAPSASSGSALSVSGGS